MQEGGELTLWRHSEGKGRQIGLPGDHIQEGQRNRMRRRERNREVEREGGRQRERER